MFGYSLQHLQRAGRFLFREQIDLQFQIVAPFRTAVYSVLADEDAGGEKDGFQRQAGR